MLPGVTVEVASDVLIEKTTSVSSSDGEGRYSIIESQARDLQRDLHADRLQRRQARGSIVPSNVTVPINAELRVGSLEETVTVSGQSPVVDVQNVSKVQVLTRELMDTIPSARNMQAIGASVPGIRLNLPDVGGAQQTEQTYMATHGNSALHNTILLDGMPAHTNLADGAVQNYIDNALVDEAVYQTSAISAESSAGGVASTWCRRTAGTASAGSGFFGGSADSWGLQSENVNDFLGGRGLASGARIDYLNDFNFAMGGPIAKDKLVVFRIASPSGHLHPGAEHVQERRIAGHRRRLDRQFRAARHVAGDPPQQARGDVSAQLQVEEARDLPRRPGRAANLP